MKRFFLIFVFFGTGIVLGMEPEAMIVPQSYFELLPEELKQELSNYALRDALEFWAQKMHEATNTDPQFSLPGFSLPFEDEYINCIAFSPNGKLIATGTDGKDVVCIWDISGNLLRILKNNGGPVKSIAFSPNSRFIASCAGDAACIWDLNTGASIRAFITPIAVFSVAFSHNGKYLATGSSDGTARIWDIASGMTLVVLTGHTFTISSVVFSPDDKLLATGSRDDTARIWDIATSTTLHTLRHADFVTSVVFSPDGKLIATGSNDRTACIWDVASGTLLHILKGHTGSITAVAFSPDGKLLATACMDKTIRMWDVASGICLAILTGHKNNVTSVAFSPDGKLLGTTSYDEQARTRIWKLYPSAQIRRTLNLLSFDDKLILKDLYQAYIDHQQFDLRNQQDYWDFLNAFNPLLKKAINTLNLVVPKLTEEAAMGMETL